MGTIAYLSPLGEQHADLRDAEELWVHNRPLSKILAQMVLELPLCDTPAETVWAQLGAVAAADTAVLLPLGDYLSEEYIEEEREYQEPEVIASMENHNRAVFQVLENNLPPVLAAVEALLVGLQGVTGLYARLHIAEMLAEYLGSYAPTYFQDFGTPPPSPQHATLEADLQNLRNGLEYLKGKGVQTVALIVSV